MPTRRHKRYRMALPLAEERQYEAELEQVGIWAANKCAELIIPALSSYGIHTPVRDSIKAMLPGPFHSRLETAVFEAFSPELLKKVISRHGQRVSDFQRHQLTQHLANAANPLGSPVSIGDAKGKDFPGSIRVGLWINKMNQAQVEDLVQDWAEDNFALIKTIPRQYLGSVENLIEKGALEGKTTRELAKEIEAHGHVAINRAKLIARDQTTKLYGRLNKERQTSVGVNRYEWDTVGDENVRETHAILNGKIYSWDQPPVTNEEGETNDPGEDIQCRCTGAPILEDLGI